MMGGDRDEAEWDETHEESLETEQLELSGDEERLPWLEGSDDDDYEDEGGEMGHTLRLALIAIVALGVIVGGIYWLTHRNPDQTLVADGSLVPADSRPYKEAPKDAGGKTFDGTGDTSFAVSEGKTKQAQLAGSGAPAPAAPVPAPTPGVAPAPASGGVGVQVGAFSSKQAAEAGWAKVTGQANGALSGVSHRVIAGSADNGTIYRLQAVAGDAAAASALCGKLKAAGISCQVK
ncbi:MAG: SPOR domain-containing protein [Novosphingobium sp.]